MSTAQTWDPRGRFTGTNLFVTSRLAGAQTSFSSNLEESMVVYVCSVFMYPNMSGMHELADWQLLVLTSELKKYHQTRI